MITLSHGVSRLLAIGRHAPTLGGKMPRVGVENLSSEGFDVDRDQAGTMISRSHADESIRDGWIMLTVYAVASGTVAVTAGAVVSLVVAGPHRLDLWAATTGATAIAAGIVRESRIITTCRLACQRLWRRLARLSPTS
jgi:hypothetical protein